MCLAVPGKIVSIEGDDPIVRTGRVSFGGIVRRVSLAYIPDASLEEYVLVHAGFAISRIDAEEADRIMGYLEQMDELGELEAAAGGEADALEGHADSVGEDDISML
jgi:hydrogenase expression/formation protein HypC